jgi:hypothetical protein
LIDSIAGGVFLMGMGGILSVSGEDFRQVSGDRSVHIPNAVPAGASSGPGILRYVNKPGAYLKTHAKHMEKWHP